MAEVSAAHDRAWISLLGGVSATVHGRQRGHRRPEAAGRPRSPRARRGSGRFGRPAGRGAVGRPSARAGSRVRCARTRRTCGASSTSPSRTGAPATCSSSIPSDVDVHRFEQLVGAGQEQLRAGNAAAAAGTLRDALSLWTGPPSARCRRRPRRGGRRRAARGAARGGGRIAGRSRGWTLGADGELVADLTAAVAAHPYREGSARPARTCAVPAPAGRWRRCAPSTRRGGCCVTRSASIRALSCGRLEAAILDHDPSLGAAAAAFGSGRSAVRRRPLTGRVRRTRTSSSAWWWMRPAPRSRVGRDGPSCFRASPGSARRAWSRSCRPAPRPWARRSLGPGAPRVRRPRTGRGSRSPTSSIPLGRLPSAPRCSPDGCGLDRRAVRAARGPGERGRARSPPRTHLRSIVIDDLQWADTASLRLLEFAAAELRRLPVVVAITTRPVEPSSPAALLDCLAELARTSNVVRLSLTGLSPAAVSDWLEDETGAAPNPDVVGVRPRPHRRQPLLRA